MNARALNERLGLPQTARPASGVYLSGPLSVEWFAGFLGPRGNPRDGRRYAEDGPVLNIEVMNGRDGILLGLGPVQPRPQAARKAPLASVSVRLSADLVTRVETVLGRPGERRTTLLTRVLDEAVRAATNGRNDDE